MMQSRQLYEQKKHGKIVYCLNTILEQKGMTMKELAEKTNIYLPVLRRTINGNTAPTFTQMARICHVLNTSVKDLLDYLPPDNK